MRRCSGLFSVSCPFAEFRFPVLDLGTALVLVQEDTGPEDIGRAGTAQGVLAWILPWKLHTHQDGGSRGKNKECKPVHEPFLDAVWCAFGFFAITSAREPTPSKSPAREPPKGPMCPVPGGDYS